MRVFNAGLAYLPWLLIVPVLAQIVEDPEVLLLTLVPAALGLLALPGIAHATRGKGKKSFVRRSTVLLLVSFIYPLVIGFVVVTGHGAGPALIAFGIGLITGTIVSALLLLASYERDAGSGGVASP